MDEPMDAEADSTQPELGKENVSQAEEHPLLRPGSMGMSTSPFKISVYPLLSYHICKHIFPIICCHKTLLK